MNRFLILFISILFIAYYVFNFKNSKPIEKFDLGMGLDLGSANEYTEFESPYKSAFDKTNPVYYNELEYQPKSQIKCCLVQNKYMPDSSQMFQGTFKYKFRKLENEQCNIKSNRLDNNSQLFIDGLNGWSNTSCNEKTNKLGSCRNVNKECIDFVDKEYCDKYKMTWSKKTCREPFEYKWIDRTSFTKPISKDDGTFIMFDKESEMGKDKRTAGDKFF
jgi:hypothetical protein